jgi:hypothetical protein
VLMARSVILFEGWEWLLHPRPSQGCDCLHHLHHALVPAMEHCLAVEEVISITPNSLRAMTRVGFEREEAREFLGPAWLWDHLDHRVRHQAFPSDPKGGAALIEHPLSQGEQQGRKGWVV